MVKEHNKKLCLGLMKFLFYITIAIIPFNLFSICLSNSMCRDNRECFDGRCLYHEEIEEGRTTRFMLTRFFDSIPLGATESFFLSEEEYLSITDGDYEEYRNNLLGEISSVHLNGNESLIKVIPGDIVPITTLSGNVVTGRQGNSIIFKGKLPEDRMDISTIVYLSGRWSILSVFDRVKER